MVKDIYSNIAERTGGDIYIGVVGPVRTGKSTFIKRFMETLVIPNIPSEFKRERALDELPQSAAGKTIMTTEPKFIPEEAVEVDLGAGHDLPDVHDGTADVLHSVDHGALHGIVPPWPQGSLCMKWYAREDEQASVWMINETCRSTTF